MRPTSTRAICAVFALFALLVWVEPARGDATDDRRALVILRVLAYDKHLGDRVGGVARIVIVCPKDDGGESARWTGAFAKLSKLKVDGRAIEIAAHAFDGAERLDRAFRDLKPAALIACDGLTRKLATEDLAKLSRANHVLSFTTREAEVARGLAVGIVPGKERDEIVVNLRAAAAEGAKFDAGLLQLARTVGGPS